MNDALAAAWRTAQARVAVTDEWRSFPSEALDRQYYRPLIALAQRAAAPQVTYDGLPIYRLLRAGERALLPQALDQARRFLLQLRERDDRTLLLHGVSGLPLSRRLAWLPVERWAMPKRFRDLAAALSEGLREIAAQLPHVWFVDEIVVAQRLGYRVANRPIVTGRPFVEALFHRRRFGFGLAETYLEVVRAYDRLRGVKVIAVDFDNTLWDGVMAEGPVRHYRDRQALLKRLQEGGILLVAVSKNDPQAIRWNEMVLQPEDFAVLAIGWELKPTTLAEIAAQLNLGLDAFVFLDDNPTERGLVASHLPQVRGLWVGAGVAAGGRNRSRRRGVAFAFPIFLFR